MSHSLFGQGLGQRYTAALHLGPISLRVDIADLGDLVLPIIVANLVPDHENDDENQHGRYNDSTNNNNHGASQKLGLHEMASHVILFRSKLDAPHDSCGSEGGDAIVVYCQDTQVIHGSSSQVIDKKSFARRRYHSEGQWKCVNIQNKAKHIYTRIIMTSVLSHFSIHSDKPDNRYKIWENVQAVYFPSKNGKQLVLDSIKGACTMPLTSLLITFLGKAELLIKATSKKSFMTYCF